MKLSDLNLNIYNLLIFAGIIQGFIFGIIVLSSKKYNNRASFCLAFVMLLMSLSNLQYWLIDTKTAEKYSFIKFTYIPWHWLIMPFFYIFVYLYIQRKEKLSKKIKLYLFVPFFVVLSIVFIQLIYKFLIDPNYELPSHFSRGIFIYLDILSILFIISIIYMIFKMLRKYELDNKKYDPLQVISETKWLKRLITIGVITCIFWIIAMGITVYSNKENLSLFYSLWLGMSIIIYYLGYVGINKLQLIKERKNIRITQTVKKEKKERKATNKIDEFFSNFVSIVNQQYNNPNLTLELISKELSISTSSLSQKIKASSGENFSTYINTLRIKKAKKMLINDEYKNYTTTAIGLEAGFNSKSSFYRAFKKIEGCTPQEFINSQK
ncbi:helix-turn-helix transcriptional regulator [Kordia sp. YSTF-M3]|uniref:Helix-turn-helix transcriptional regulator n=1 Tax=Kordia aestuariivivens TaxID=2759037 RepID=A0ABR7Q5U8_9FLAO|nr:helix-turn-helix transcriptional regulator [Kordia aestuariivivens]MBC8753946.1 helix-turn-helix transcriptional regulator [Kordia aestuariivivens]